MSGCTALIVDDFTISAGTLVDAARVLVERGATSVYAAVSHGLLAGPALERLDDSPIERLFMTDSVETQPLGPVEQGGGHLRREALRRSDQENRQAREHLGALRVADRTILAGPEGTRRQEG